MQLRLYSCYCTVFGKVRTLTLKTIIEAVLTNVRFVFRVMTKYEETNSFEAMVSNSFPCRTTKLSGAGRPVIASCQKRADRILTTASVSPE